MGLVWETLAARRIDSIHQVRLWTPLEKRYWTMRKLLLRLYLRHGSNIRVQFLIVDEWAKNNPEEYEKFAAAYRAKIAKRPELSDIAPVTPTNVLRDVSAERGTASSFLEGALGDGGSTTGTSTPTTSENGATDVSTPKNAVDMDRSLVLGTATVRNGIDRRSSSAFLEGTLGDDSITGTSASTTPKNTLDMNTTLVLGTSTVILVLGLYLCRRQLRSWFCPKRAVPVLAPASDAKAQGYGSLSALEDV
ncbi:unnamed protein product [Amoebophrya sp. A25]|nr:unnamed protein product [Amoebophrya sp. A25]|eukprot:GSA25T00018424001.1